ncbi:hypothetical protein Bca101_010985 [Brassica carinata]
MREMAKAAGKKKAIPKKVQDSPVIMEDETRIISIVNAILRPELNRIDGDIGDVVSSLKEVSAESAAYEKKVIAIVEGMFQSFKTEMMASTSRVNTQIPVQPPNFTAVFDGGEDEGGPGKTTPVARDGNDGIIQNVLENISHYSTPPAAENEYPGSNAASRSQQSVNPFDGTAYDNSNGNEVLDPHTGYDGKTRSHQSINPFDGTAEENNNGNEMVDPHLVDGGSSNPNLSNMSSAGKVGESRQDHSSRSAHSQTHDHPDATIPSFSLGLTQEVGSQHNDEDEMGDNEDQLGEEGNGEGVGDARETLLCRKSKRIRTVPPQLLTDYQCETAILNRAREGQIFGNSTYDAADIQEKYNRLKLVLKKDCVINVAGLPVTGKDLLDIGERNRFLPGRVIDILMRGVAACVKNQVCDTSDTTTVFLDSRVPVLLSRNFPKFRRTKSGTHYLFTKAVIDMVKKSSNFNPAASRFYMPLAIARKHWIGICVDINAGKIYLLDCNTELTIENALTREIAPVREMFPSLLKHCGCLSEYLEKPVVVESVKGVVQNTNPAEAAMTACLLIQTHALYGPETCTSISPSLIPDESQRAAVMIYEFHKKL